VNHSILNKIINWAENESEIRTLILEGSRASNAPTDELSDYDLNVFVVNPDKYTSSGNSWINNFDQVLVYQKEKFFYKNIEIPTRLVLYKNNPRVDFSFWPINVLYEIIENRILPESYRNGYEVLLDKDKVTGNIILPNHDGFIITQPTEDELLTTLYNFWFEACSVAKYLKRDRLWFAKILENGPIKGFMLQIILWNESSKDDWNNNKIHSQGKNLETQVDIDIKKSFKKCFSKYDKSDTWDSLFGMIELFKRLAYELTVTMNVKYPKDSISEIEKYIRQLNER
jgi:aminoglycoside 6-adenylyltransferase